MQQIMNALVLGGVYGLFALGFTLVFGVLNILNLAHVATVALGGLATFYLISATGLPFLATILGAMAVGMTIGIVIYFVAFTPLKLRGGGNESMSGLVASIALLSVIQAIMLGTVGAQARNIGPSAVPRKTLEFAGSSIDTLQLGALAASLAIMFMLLFAINRTPWGRSLRAVAREPEAALVTGVNVRRKVIETFAVSGALGGLAGALLVSLFGSAAWDLGVGLELKALAVVILGGLGSAKGAILGGYLLAAAEVSATVFLSSGYADAVAFLVIYVVLILRPEGLFAVKRTRVA